MKSKFERLPVALKLVVILFFLLGLSSFWRFGSDIGTRHVLDIGPLISGFIFWGLAVGLINRSDEARWWAAFFTFLGTMFGFFLLAIAIFEDPNSTEGFNFSYDKLTRTQTIIFIVAYLALNVGTLLTLLRPKTKMFFSSQTIQEGK